MTRSQEKANRWRFRLWHLFAAMTLLGLTSWLSQHVSFGIGYGKVQGSYEGYALLKWDDRYLVDWDTMKDEHGIQVFP